MKVPFWLLALLFLLWGGWSFYNYYCAKCGCCGGETTAVSVAGPATPLFKCGEGVLASANYKDYRDSILKTGGQGDTLVITGLYYSDETEAVGQARASAFRQVLGNKLPDDRVRTAARQMDGDCAAALAASGIAMADGSKGIRGVDLNWNKLVLKLDEGAIIESDSSVTFLFPFNSTEKDRDPKVEAYLQKLIDKHKGSTASFGIVGHTDHVGSDESNMKLGMARAESIANILIKGGIAADRIKNESRGKSEPVASNETDEGRHLNRRVVVTINQ